VLSAFFGLTAYDCAEALLETKIRLSPFRLRRPAHQVLGRIADGWEGAE